MADYKGNGMRLFAGIVLTAVLAGCGGGGSGADGVATAVAPAPATSVVDPAPVIPDPVAPPPPVIPPTPSTGPIAAWGDSLTRRYVLEIGTVLPGRTVFGGGVAGNSSTQIAARQGAVVPLLTLVGNSIPASGSVNVTAQSVAMQTTWGPGDIAGTIGGVHGTLAYDNVATYTFTRTNAGTATAVATSEPFTVDTFGRRDWTSIFWYGQNNYWQPAVVKADLAASVAFLTHGRFVILSVINGANEGTGTLEHTRITQLNRDLAALYPNNYIDVRAYLVSQYDPTLTQDVIDHAADTVPLSLRADAVHLTPAGSLLVLSKVKEFLDARGW